MGLECGEYLTQNDILAVGGCPLTRYYTDILREPSVGTKLFTSHLSRCAWVLQIKAQGVLFVIWWRSRRFSYKGGYSEFRVYLHLMHARRQRRGSTQIQTKSRA